MSCARRSGEVAHSFRPDTCLRVDPSTTVFTGSDMAGRRNPVAPVLLRALAMGGLDSRYSADV